MLRELFVENFAVIDKLHLELGPGFTVLTGETGAGKSIIVGALGAACGERLTADVIRSGEETARVEAIFDASSTPKLSEILDQAGIDQEGDLLIITRSIALDRSRYWVNRRPVTLALVQELTRHLVDIHGQHEHQALLHERVNLQFLDEFGGQDIRAVREEFGHLWSQLQEALQRLASLRQAERDRAHREDLLRFQVTEIRNAGLRPGEEQALRDERSRLQNAERIIEALRAARHALGGNHSPGAADLLAQAARDLLSVAQFDTPLGDIARQIEQASMSVAEALRSLDDHADLLDFDPRRLEEVESRLAEIQRLKRKYGDTVEDILAHLERAEAELADLQSGEELIEQLQRQIEQLRLRAGDAAERLSALRHSHAQRLEQVVQRELASLGMKHALFKVEMSREEHQDGLPAPDGRSYLATATGLDRVRFLFDAAGGDDLRSLSQVASGGELSRLMLIFKTVCARGADIPTLIFDEIDANVGGLTAHALGKKLQQLARKTQVLCVTHLPQIASRADHHIFVDRRVLGKRASVSVKVLHGDERIEELARMLGARKDHQAAREHAEQLLAEAARDRGQPEVSAR
jgi:DNA repair protein RecN (Recombination protein N)